MAAVDMSRLLQGWRVVVALGKQSVPNKVRGVQFCRQVVGLWNCLVCMAAVDMSRLLQGWRVVVALRKQSLPAIGGGTGLLSRVVGYGLAWCAWLLGT
jgi:hypothetical protein